MFLCQIIGLLAHRGTRALSAKLVLANTTYAQASGAGGSYDFDAAL